MDFSVTLEQFLLFVCFCVVAAGVLHLVCLIERRRGIVLNTFWVVIVMLILFLGFEVVSNRYAGYRLFSLNRSNTLYEYQAASTDQKVDWLLRQTKYPYSLGLISNQEATCGYTLSEKVFDRCLNEALYEEKPWSKLGKLARECAVLSMEKTQTPYRAEDCREQHNRQTKTELRQMQQRMNTLKEREL